MGRDVSGGGRILLWSGCFNVRDVGPLELTEGSLPKGALVRSDSLERLSEDGWSQLGEYGIRTVIDLRNVGEAGPACSDIPAGITRVHLPLDAIEDREFWDYWRRDLRFGTPRYYLPHLSRFPERSVAVLRAVAEAPPGGVLIHCGLGRDRTGLIVMALLTLLGADPEAIADDYMLSAQCLQTFWPQQGLPDQDREIAEMIQGEGTSLRALVRECAESGNVQAYLRSGGLTDADLERLGDRLLAR